MGGGGGSDRSTSRFALVLFCHFERNEVKSRNLKKGWGCLDCARHDIKTRHDSKFGAPQLRRGCVSDRSTSRFALVPPLVAQIEASGGRTYGSPPAVIFKSPHAQTGMRGFGVSDRSRTCGLKLRRLALYPTELRAHLSLFFHYSTFFGKMLYIFAEIW